MLNYVKTKALNINIWLFNIANAVGAVLFFLVSFWSVFRVDWILYVVSACAFIICLLTMCNKLSEEIRWSTLFYVCFFFYIVISFVAANNIRVTPSWDFKGIFDNATSLAIKGKLYDRFPLERYPNNIMPTMVYALWYKIILFFGRTPSVESGMILNMFFVHYSIWSTFKVCKVQFGDKIAFFCSLLMFFFLPLIGYMPILYTDTMAMPIVITCVWIEVLLCEKIVNGRRKRMLLRIMEGILFAIGFKIKATVAIVLLAILLYSVLKISQEYRERRILEKVLLIIAFISVLLCINTGIDSSGFFDEQEYYDLQFPYTHWVKMGLWGHGGWNASDVESTMEIIGYDEKKEENIQVIKMRLEDYGIKGMLNLWSKKAAFTWGDGTYYVSNKLNREPIFDNKLSDFFRLTGEYNDKFIIYCNLFHTIIMILMLLVVGKSLLYRKDIEPIQVILQFSLYGLTLFLLLWETRSRYLIHFYPIFVILDGYGLQMLLKYKKHKILENT